MKKFILSIIMVALLGGVAWAYDFSAVCSSGQTLYYNITSAVEPYTVEVTSENSGSPYYNTYPTGTLIIPESITNDGITYSVTSIGYYAFGYCDELTSVTMPNSVISIGESAFSGCYVLVSAPIPNSVTSIDDYAFCNCRKLASVSIPNSVTSIGNEAFSNCYLLESVTIGNSVMNIGDYAFWHCGRMTSIIMGNGVRSIGQNAFRDCNELTSVYYTGSIAQWCEIIFYTGASNPLCYAHNLYINNNLVTDLVIPETVTEIKGGAFYGATCLTSVTIPISLTSIGNYAFQECSGLTRVNYMGNIEQWCGISFGNSTANPISYANNLYLNNGLVADLVIPNTVTDINNYVFVMASCLTSVTFGNSVTSIGAGAFGGCSGLTTIVIPNSVTSIGNSAFSGCTGLTSVVIGNSVTSIGEYAFSGCSGMTSVAIGNSVSNIGNYAFASCSSLTSFTIPNSVTSIGGFVFQDCNALTTINFNATNCTTMGDYSNQTYYSTFRDCSSLTTLNIGSNVTNIPLNAFRECRGLTGDLIIPDSVENIGGWAFQYCFGLTSITIGNGVTNIGDYAFNYCSGLTGGLTIPNSVVSIGNGAFSGCIGLSGDLIIPNSVQNIGYNTNDGYQENSGAFSRCSGFTSLAIGDSVRNIGNFAFYDCNGLTCDLSIPNSVENIGRYAFNNCSGLTSATIGNSVTSIGQGAFSSCYGLSAITIGNSVESIGNFAFTGCGNLSAFNFNAENCIETISDYWFSTNTRISKMTIGENVITIPNKAFKNCTDIDSIVSAAMIPPVIYASTFDSNLSYNIPVVVPCGTVSAYEDADFWYNFRHIQQSADCGASYTITVVSANPNRGTVDGGGTYPVGTVVTISATANEGYVFTSWNDNNTENPRQITVTGDATYIASFEDASSVQTYTITAMTANPNRGTVTGGGTYPAGTIVTLTASANDGYVFTSWNDDNTENPRQITVTGDATYIASFEDVSSVQTYTITVMSSNSNRGSVTGGGTYAEGTIIMLAATANEGYEFSSWNDDNTDNPRTITVVADATYIASFMSVVGIEENAVSEISLFPNPTGNILNITSSEMISSVEFVSITGQIISRVDVNGETAVCNVEGFAPGMYFVRISGTDGSVIQRKFVKE